MTDFTPFNTVAQTRFGQLIYNVNDVYIGRSVELYGEFSQGETLLFEQLVEPGEVVLEVGANIGTHTLFFAKQVGPAGRVLAFEPQRILFQTLCGNLALNSVTNTHCWNMAVGSEAGEITVPALDYARADNFGGIELGMHEQGESVPLATIDSFQLPRCDFIKVDVEGMEEDVFRGAAETIARCKPILYCECDRTDKSDSLIRLLDSLGYTMFWHLPPLFHPQNFAGNPTNVFGEIVSKNILCVDAAIAERLSGFVPVDVPESSETHRFPSAAPPQSRAA